EILARGQEEGLQAQGIDLSRLHHAQEELKPGRVGGTAKVGDVQTGDGSDVGLVRGQESHGHLAAAGLAAVQDLCLEEQFSQTGAAGGTAQDTLVEGVREAEV